MKDFRCDFGRPAKGILYTSWTVFFHAPSFVLQFQIFWLIVYLSRFLAMLRAQEDCVLLQQSMCYVDPFIKDNSF